MSDLRELIRRAIYHDVEKLFRGLRVYSCYGNRNIHGSLRTLGGKEWNAFLESLSKINTLKVIKNLESAGISLKKTFHVDVLPVSRKKLKGVKSDYLASATSRKLKGIIAREIGEFNILQIAIPGCLDSEFFILMPALLLHGIKSFERLLLYYFKPKEAHLATAIRRVGAASRVGGRYECEKYAKEFLSQREPVGQAIGSYIYLLLSEKPGIEKVDKRDFRLRTTLYRSEDVGVPAIPLGVHIALSAAFEASKVEQGTLEFSFTHVTLSGYKRAIYGLPYTFRFAERGYLKLLRAVNAIFYAYLLAALYALSKELGAEYRYYHGIIFSPADMMLIFEYTKDFEGKLRRVLGDIYEVFKEPRTFDYGDGMRTVSLRVVPSYTIYRNIKEPKAEYELKGNRASQKDFGPIALVSSLGEPLGLIAKPEKVNIKELKKGSRFLILIVEHDGKIYPLILLRQKDGSFKSLLEFEGLKGELKAEKAVRLIYKALEKKDSSPLRAHLEERLELSHDLPERIELEKFAVSLPKNDKLLGSIGLLIHPQQDVENLDERFDKRVFHRRFIYRDPLSIYRENTDLGLAYYAALILEAVHVLGLDLRPIQLKELKPFVIASLRDESYLLTRPGKPSVEFLEALELLDEHEVPIELILQDYNIKKPIYAARAETDKYVVRPLRRPIAFAFGLPLRLKELKEAFELSEKIEVKSAEITYTKRLAEFLIGLSEKLVEAIEEGSEYRSKLSEEEKIEFLALAAHALTRLDDEAFKGSAKIIAKAIYDLLRDPEIGKLSVLIRKDEGSKSRAEFKGKLESIANLIEASKERPEEIYELLVLASRIYKKVSKENVEASKVLFKYITQVIYERDEKAYERNKSKLLLLVRLLLLMIAHELSFEDLKDGDPVSEALKLCVGVRLAEISEEEGKRVWSSRF